MLQIFFCLCKINQLWMLKGVEHFGGFPFPSRMCVTDPSKLFLNSKYIENTDKNHKLIIIPFSCERQMVPCAKIQTSYHYCFHEFPKILVTDKPTKINLRFFPRLPPKAPPLWKIDQPSHTPKLIQIYALPNWVIVIIPFIILKKPQQMDLLIQLELLGALIWAHNDSQSVFAEGQMSPMLLYSAVSFQFEGFFVIGDEVGLQMIGPIHSSKKSFPYLFITLEAKQIPALSVFACVCQPISTLQYWVGQYFSLSSPSLHIQVSLGVNFVISEFFYALQTFLRIFCFNYLSKLAKLEEPFRPASSLKIEVRLLSWCNSQNSEKVMNFVQQYSICQYFLILS